MNRRLARQVERILDEGSGSHRSVIVRMKLPETDEETLLGAVVGAIQRRSLLLTARDILPTRLDVVAGPVGGVPSGRAREALEEEGGLAAQVAATAIRQASRRVLRSRGLRSLRPLDSSLRELGRGTRGSRSFWTSRCVLLQAARDELARLNRLVEEPLIGDIYPNRVLHLPRLVELKRLPPRVVENKASAWGIHAAGALAARGAYGARGKGVKVGVLDTGVDASHPDLKGKVADWAEFDADGAEVSGSRPHDTGRHGTHVAGTIAGGQASGRWIGMAPEARLAVAIALDGAKGGTDAQVLAAIDWAVERGVDVLNLSLGGLTLGPEVPSTYTEAILTSLRAGIPVVTAIGNDGQQVTGSPGNDLLSFSVGATDYRDCAAAFSGGRTHVIRESGFVAPENLPLVYSKPEISAPGVAVFSSVPGGKWAAFNGTSMATPHVAGAMALLLSATSIKKRVAPTNRAFLIQDLLTGSVEELGETGQDHRFGFGRLDVLQAIGFAREKGF